MQISNVSALDKTHPRRSCHPPWLTGERATRSQQYCLGPAISHGMQPCLPWTLCVARVAGNERIQNMNKEGIPTVNTSSHCDVFEKEKQTANCLSNCILVNSHAFGHFSNPSFGRQGPLFSHVFSKQAISSCFHQLSGGSK